MAKDKPQELLFKMVGWLSKQRTEELALRNIQTLLDEMDNDEAHVGEGEKDLRSRRGSTQDHIAGLTNKLGAAYLAFDQEVPYLAGASL
mmetsp:Transcript_24689/g.72253  ORF Transcript_24689/g.72253 Transcript_24689/m.72253 type:complete len:89 (+) Transcript_24689:2618-2884(+)